MNHLSRKLAGSLAGLLLLATSAVAFEQAPSLDSAVESGELPTVDERLPKDPRVMKPLNEVGTFGGTLRRCSAAVNDYLTENFTRESLTSWMAPLTDAGPPQPNLASSWEYAEDGLSVTVNLREGIRWSDGELFTAEDIEFYWNDILLDDQVARPFPGILMVDGQPPELEVLSDYQIRFTFPRPYFFFEEAHASVWEIAWPKHLMAESHPKHNPSATYQDLNTKLSLQSGRGKVTLQAWMLEDYVEGDHYHLTRNPYYWKVDTEGNQLPYMDKAQVNVVEDRQGVALALVAGECDLDAMWVGIQHINLFSSAIEAGRDVSLTFADFQGMAIYFNLDAEDAATRSIFRDPAFRRALSMAIDRQEISDLYYAGLLIPGNAAFNPVLPYSNEVQLALWSNFDPEAAKLMLEEAGYKDTNGDGVRESPDGTPLDFVIDVAQHDLYTGIVELMSTEYFPEIGVKLTMNVGEQTTVRDAFDAGDFQIHVWDYEGSGYPLSGNLDEIAPGSDNMPPWHRNWKADPTDHSFLRLAQLVRGATGVSYDERVNMMTEASQLHADNAWIIHLGYFQRPFLKSNRLGNAPDQITRNDQVNDMPAWGAELLFERYAPGAAPTK